MERTLFREGDLALAEENGELILHAGEGVYRLASHPYEPCTYLYQGETLRSAVHNAFTLEELRALAEQGGAVRAVTGSEYDVGRACRLLAYAAENCPDRDLSYAEGAIALEDLKALGALSPETAVSPEAVGVRRISDAFSHSKKRKERVMVTEEGTVYVRIKE